MVKNKKCLICGSLFATSFSAKYCSVECRNIAKLRREKNYNTIKKDVPLEKIDLKEERPKENNLVELSMAARAAGMTYGQYMALEYAKKHPIVRTWR